MIGYFYDICAIIALVGISWGVSYYCSSESLQLGGTDGYFSLPVACITPSSTMKASQIQEGNKGQQKSPLTFEVLWDLTGQWFKKRYPILVLGLLSGSLWYLIGVLSRQGQFYFKLFYMSLCIFYETSTSKVLVILPHNFSSTLPSHLLLPLILPVLLFLLPPYITLFCISYLKSTPPMAPYYFPNLHGYFKWITWI